MFLVKKSKQAGVKHSMKKLFSLTLKICLQTLAQYCLRKQIFIPISVQNPSFYIFLKILLFEKAHLLFNLIFNATQLQKIPEYDIFQKTLFCALASTMNL